MILCYICDMCDCLIDAKEVNIVSFFERYTVVNDDFPYHPKYFSMVNEKEA